MSTDLNPENTAGTGHTAAARPVLKGLSDIFTYFRTNDVPIWFVSPTPYNVLGLDRWVRRFEYVCYFDSFDGWHPKVRIPRETGPREFRSIEDVNNYLLSHKEIADRMRAAGGGKLANRRIPDRRFRSAISLHQANRQMLRCNKIRLIVRCVKSQNGARIPNINQNLV